MDLRLVTHCVLISMNACRTTVAVPIRCAQINLGHTSAPVQWDTVKRIVSALISTNVQITLFAIPWQDVGTQLALHLATVGWATLEMGLTVRTLTSVHYCLCVATSQANVSTPLGHMSVYAQQVLLL